MRVVVAMPAYNEARGVREFLEEVVSAMSPHDIALVVADDCSTDNTLHVLASLRLSHPLIVLPAERNLGHGPTTLRALRESLEHKPDVVVAVDGDGQFTGEDMRRLVDLLTSQGFDLVEGVRVGRNDPFFRRVTSWATQTLVQSRIGERPRDANTPLRIYRPPVLEALLQAVPANSITPNLLISALSRVSVLNISEEQVTSVPRRGGNPAGTNWRGRHASVPSTRFLKFCLQAGRQWTTSSLRPVSVPRDHHQ
jgi:dolichol-phosphate mannosyltransferase